MIVKILYIKNTILYIKLVGTVWQVARAKTGCSSQVGLGIFSALVGLAVMFMFDLLVRVHSILNLFWMFASLVTAMRTQLERTEDRG